MDINNLDKEQVLEMSDEEIMMWYSIFERKEKVELMRKQILNEIDMRVASEVIDHA